MKIRSKSIAYLFNIYHLLLQNGVTDGLAKHFNSPANETVFYTTFKTTLNKNQEISDAEKSKLLSEAELAIKEYVQPGMKAIKDYLEQEYLKNTRNDIGISTLKGGMEFYRQCIRW